MAVGNDDGFVDLYDIPFHNIIEKEQVKPGWQWKLFCYVRVVSVLLTEKVIEATFGRHR